jgi:integrase
MFPDTKNGEDRIVPLGQQALNTLREMHRTPGPVFVRTNGKPIKDFRRAWLKALKAAGLGKHLFHGNRRSQAINLMTAGVDEQTAMEITGHKDSETFRGYRVLVEEAKRAAIAKRDSMMSCSAIKPSSSRVADPAAETAHNEKQLSSGE